MAIAIFYISLCVIIIMLAMHYFELGRMHNRKVVEIVKKNDAYIESIVTRIKEIISHIHFDNVHKLILWVVRTTKYEMIVLKRRFDSKQPKFLLKPQKTTDGQKHTASFFLKHITEHKENLKQKDM